MKKNITLSSGRELEINVTLCEDGNINVDCNEEISQEEADEIANLI